jgi:hypothetical protein
MDTTRKLGRRGLLAGGVGALVAALFGKVSSASADDGGALVLGEQNTADQTTQLVFGGTGAALEIDWGDPARGNVSRAVIGDGTHNGTPVYGEIVPAVQRAWTAASAGWFNGGQSPGAVGVSDSHIGVIGLSGPVPAISPQELDPAGGHFVGQAARGCAPAAIPSRGCSACRTEASASSVRRASTPRTRTTCTASTPPA